MRYGFVLPTGDARDVANLAQVAESAGWDALFVWEPVYGVEAWISLAAAAMVTSRIKLGTMLSPLSRMRPWKFAGEVATVDRLSGGRVIVAVGLGAPDTGFAAFGEVVDRRTRAELLDEGLAIVTGLWRGQPFSFSGEHYTILPTEWSGPSPAQQPGPPIWVVGAWPAPKSMARALRHDGIIPQIAEPGKPTRQATVNEVAQIVAHIRQQRGADAFDIIVEGQTPGDDRTAAQAQIVPWRAAGATWWIECLWDSPAPDVLAAVRVRLEQGPPELN